MSAQASANGLAFSFLRLNTLPHQVSPAIHKIRPLMTKRRIHEAVALTAGGICGTKLALSSIYAVILKGGCRLRRRKAFAPVQWLEYPADYVPPKMNLLVEDQAPFGKAFLSPLACPKDSEHLERAFDLMRYQYLAIVNHDMHVVPPLRIRGTDTSSGSFLSALEYMLGGEKDTYGDSAPPRIKISMASITLIALLGLIAKHGRSHLVTVSLYELWMMLRYFWDCLGSHQDGGADDDLCHGNCAPVSLNQEPSPYLTVAVLVNPEQSLEYFLEDDSLGDSYTPYVLLEFSDNASQVRSNISSLKDDSAPDVFAALFDALQDALSFFQELENLTGKFPRPRNLPRFVLLGMALILCFALHVVGFFVKGRLRSRGIQRLTEELKLELFDSTDSDVVEIDDDEDRSEVVMTLVEEEVEPVPIELTTEEMNMYEEIVIRYAAMSLYSQPSNSASCAAPVLVKTVETELAPVVDEDKAEKEDENGSVVDTCCLGEVAKDKETKTEKEFSDEPPLPFMKRRRGRRGRGRGLGPRPSEVSSSDT